jgi:putative ABC transport system ATP-binding protein
MVADPGKNGTEVMVEVHGLTRDFGSGSAIVHAVDHVNLAVGRGEIILIMGPSGSGKTTLLTMIGGLLRPDSGTVRIDGLEITGMNEHQLPRVRRHLVGFVFQSFNLLESLNASENVEVALNLAGKGGPGAHREADRVLSGLGLGDRLRFKIRDLSGGEKQRVSLARALVNNPQVILADEPTANLDSKHGREVMVVLRDIAKKQNRTVIIVSHDQRIREVVDRVLWLEDGRFKEIGKLVRDPVCGMPIEETVAATAIYQAAVYHFCSVACRDEFMRAPSKFVGNTGPAASLNQGVAIV